MYCLIHIGIMLSPSNGHSSENKEVQAYDFKCSLDVSAKHHSEWVLLIIMGCCWLTHWFSIFFLSWLQIPLKLHRKPLLKPEKPIVLKVVPRDVLITGAWLFLKESAVFLFRFCLRILESLIYFMHKTDMKMRINQLNLIHG